MELQAFLSASRALSLKLEAVAGDMAIACRQNNLRAMRAADDKRAALLAELDALESSYYA